MGMVPVPGRPTLPLSTAVFAIAWTLVVPLAWCVIPMAQAKTTERHAASRAAEGPKLFITEAEMNGHAGLGADQHAVTGHGLTHPSEGITLLQIDGNQAVRTDVAEG